MITIKDVAKKSNYSISSVSKALNGYTDIGEPAREYILQIAKEMGYTANYHARALKTTRTYSIGIVYTHNSNYGLKNEFFSWIINYIQQELEDYGYDIILLNSKIGPNQKSYLEHALYRGVDGVFIVCADPNEEQIIQLGKTKKLPVVSIDMSFGNSLSVFSDNYAGMKKLTKYIIECGHKRIAYIHGMDSQITRNRVKGFVDTMAEHSLSIPDNYLVEAGYGNSDLVFKRTTRLLAADNRPTCIILPDDLTTIGAINAITASNLNYPNDVSIAGYDGIQVGKLMSPKITTIEQDSQTIGKYATKVLLEAIENKGLVAQRTHKIDSHLLVGGSVIKIN